MHIHMQSVYVHACIVVYCIPYALYRVYIYICMYTQIVYVHACIVVYCIPYTLYRVVITISSYLNTLTSCQIPHLDHNQQSTDSNAMEKTRSKSHAVINKAACLVIVQLNLPPCTNQNAPSSLHSIIACILMSRAKTCVLHARSTRYTCTMLSTYMAIVHICIFISRYMRVYTVSACIP
jgi:hypothetical protein